ncbi:UDP-N-acetylmuramoyl-L-alanine--D-glutamate ligase [Methylophilaceae bacterium]|jgi:UDP-N-acetylmuramoylalanine--D-glutamate ligase|nr:UDP-N-acetylmuramoyl-L-alanine--D-glutamate ligase [Methylophilaceae bacterium]|tara:strand:- start:8266 stop:9600 length:1335 start_codon:yes stop_codon:yes gene_type:complete
MNENINHILILGCGQTGLSIGRYLDSSIKISFYDESEISLNNARNLFATKEHLYFSGDLKEAYFDDVDCVAISPGVDPRHPIINKIIKKGVPFHNDISLFFLKNDLLKTKVIGVTGTNGKTTVCSMIEQIALESGLKARAVGNIGLPILNINQVDTLDVLIIELSSFQLEVINNGKIDVGVILNISDDHMDRYNSFTKYFQAKEKLFGLSKINIINRDDGKLNTLRHKATLSFGISESNNKKDYILTNNHSGACIERGGKATLELSNFRLIGEHNKLNIMAAIACMQSAFPELNEFKINNLKGVKHRLEWVKSKEGVNFYNDSKATNVNATITALKSFDKKNILLVAGGDSKNQILKPLFKYLKQKVSALYLIGQDAHIFEENFNSINSLKITNHKRMKDAVLSAYEDASFGDIVLLSPACASYDMYKNYKERGNEYKSIVEKL